MTTTETHHVLEPDPAAESPGPATNQPATNQPGANQLTADPPEAAAAVPEPAPALASAPAPARTAHPAATRRRPSNPVFRAVAVTVSLIGMAAVGFFAYFYGFSSLAESRSQYVLYKTFAGELGEATAPTGAAPDGAPVAIIDIPALGISKLVVVEGTTSADLTHGPGLYSSSALPGQAGTSVIYGRAAAFGGPFEHLMRLDRGARITVITAQGTSIYSVVSFGDSAHPAHNPLNDQLDLETADGSFFANGYEEVTADLLTVPKLNPGGRPAAGPQEGQLDVDTVRVVPLILWAEALIIIALGAVLMARRWSRSAVLLCSTPVALALLWMVYENIAVLLPNLY
jgi:sortase A